MLQVASVCPSAILFKHYLNRLNTHTHTHTHVCVYICISIQLLVFAFKSNSQQKCWISTHQILFSRFRKSTREGKWYLNLERRCRWSVSLNNFTIFVHQKLLKVPLDHITQETSCTWFQKLINRSGVWSIYINLLSTFFSTPYSTIYTKHYYGEEVSNWHTLLNIGNSALNLVQANCLISGFDPGSWPPNWLQGKASISNPTMMLCKDY